MPFMPEMFAFCGQRFEVYKSAHKTCDTVRPIGAGRLNETVHLETRCSGVELPPGAWASRRAAGCA